MKLTEAQLRSLINEEIGEEYSEDISSKMAMAAVFVALRRVNEAINKLEPLTGESFHLKSEYRGSRLMNRIENAVDALRRSQKELYAATQLKKGSR